MTWLPSNLIHIPRRIYCTSITSFAWRAGRPISFLGICQILIGSSTHMTRSESCAEKGIDGWAGTSSTRDFLSSL
ncbi:hypothetical protein EJ05DRAFT_474103 [Pseudovirgaria hyperparasitica]|uniref:Uncharacterized protein n=1 Tax=Pseudovirgaria hyperparasitica TaxID=470096 RepID=A0A6A6WDF3_9PEZI|nr:uncharacterized protein EJ05DRAFT_474103 [Pseudovirgaria hyperparasitica]KAF2760209.1 hypothetical protein EJ05DRAFT_474103 [Pseudovirgaria hyperparasitica]